MKARQDREIGNEAGGQSTTKLIGWLVLAIVTGVALVITPGAKDIFRLPKDLYFLAGMICLGAFVATAFVARRLARPWFRVTEPALLIGGAVLVWTIVSALFSSNRALSIPTVNAVAIALLFFLCALHAARRYSIHAVIAVLFPAAVNGLIVTFQEMDLWRPIELEQYDDRHLGTTGLMGNPNDAGTLLAASGLAAVTLLLLSKGRLRAVSALLSVLMISGLVASQTLTAILAFAAGLFVLFPLVYRKHALRVTLVLILLAVSFFSLFPPAARRVSRLAELAVSGNYNLLVTNRITPFLAAWEMARQHPWTGVGPGTFGWNYLQYRPFAETRFPRLRESAMQSGWNFNFGEVHNDHLEVLAESGIPGYLLFLASLVVLARFSFRPHPQLLSDAPRQPSGALERGGKERRGNGGKTSESGLRSRFSQALALPLVVCLFVLGLAQFPLQLTAPTVSFLYLAALIIGWSSSPAGLGGNPVDSSDRPPASFTPPRLPRPAVVSIIIMLAFSAGWLTYRYSFLPYRCNIVELDLQDDTAIAMRLGDPAARISARENLDQVNRLLRHCRSANLRMIQAVNLKILRRPRDAAKSYQEALRLDRRPEIYFQLGLTQVSLGLHDAGVRNLIVACDFQPTLLDDVPGQVRAEVEAAVRKRTEELRSLRAAAGRA